MCNMVNQKDWVVLFTKVWLLYPWCIDLSRVTAYTSVSISNISKDASHVPTVEIILKPYENW